MRKEDLQGNVWHLLVRNRYVFECTVNSKISAGMAYKFECDDRSELNLFMLHDLVSKGYDRNSANRICKCVIAHCNDEIMLNGIHNDLPKGKILACHSGNLKKGQF